MLKVRESLLHSEADSSHGHAVGEQHIADDVTPHQPLALFLTSKKACGVHGHTIRPGQEGVLSPPPGHYQRYVEPKHKSKWDGGELLVTIGAQRFKHLS